MTESRVHTDKRDSIYALQISNFSTAELYRTITMGANEETSEASTRNGDEESMYKNNVCMENVVEVDDISHSPTKRKGDEIILITSDKKPKYNSRKKKWRKEKQWAKYGHLPSSSTKEKFIDSAKVWKISTLVSDLRMKDGGYTAMPSCFRNMPEIQSLEEAISLGFLLVKLGDNHQPISDRQGRVVAVLAPPPKDLSYAESTRRAAEKMRIEANKANFQPDELKDPNRGDYHAVNVGLSYGQGHIKPINRDVGRFGNLVRALLEDVNIQRLASYQDATYALWHPKAYQYYSNHLERLREAYPGLAPRLFPRSIMPSAAFNVGNRVATKKHVDSQNCPFGWCTITALGDFDASKGGHLILWDLGLVLEFPAGACICLPSALVTHSNIPTADNELRMSFTQYCSGEIFRYIENGFQTDSALKKNLKQNDIATLLFRKTIRKTRVEDGYEMFSKIEDLMDNQGRKRMML